MIVLIAGMHRSGTSALAGLLHKNGIHMGDDKDFYPPPMKENPRGFFENVRFRRINDAILLLHGYKVKSFSTTLPTVVSANNEITSEMRKLILKFSAINRWGFKDPRICLTIQPWLVEFLRVGKLNRVKIINIKRSLEDIARSMRARGNKEQYDLQFAKLASQYQFHFERSVLSFIKQHNEDVSITAINFRDIIFNTEKTAIKLSDFLGYAIADLSFVDRRISKYA